MSKSEIAVENFLKGYNCAQSVVAAFCGDLGADRKTCLMLSEGFGGGMGRLREVCGAVSGMFMLAGLKYSNAEPKDLTTRKLVYSKVQKMAAEFRTEMGSIICSELLSGIDLSPGSTPTQRDTEFYKKRPCVECIRTAAKIAERVLNED